MLLGENTKTHLKHGQHLLLKSQAKGIFMALLLFACLPSLLMSGSPILLLWCFFANIKAGFFGIPTQAEGRQLSRNYQTFSTRLELWGRPPSRTEQLPGPWLFQSETAWMHYKDHIPQANRMNRMYTPSLCSVALKNPD